jgi:hypothetical protein
MKTRSVEKARKTTHGAKHVHWNEMNRKQRREMMRKIQSADLSLEVVHPDCPYRKLRSGGFHPNVTMLHFNCFELSASVFILSSS